MNDLTTLMRSRVEHEHHPDLSGLLTGAVDQGRTLQRRRRLRYAGVSVAAAAFAAGALAGGAMLGGGGDSSATELQPAAGTRSLDVSSPHPAPSAIALDPIPLHGVTLPATPPITHQPSMLPGASEPVPFVLKLAGWSCGDSGDEKLICDGPRGRSVVVTWRSSDGYQAWIASPDKGAAPDVVTTAPHGAWFATVIGNAKASPADLHAVADAIRWK